MLFPRFFPESGINQKSNFQSKSLRWRKIDSQRLWYKTFPDKFIFSTKAGVDVIKLKQQKVGHLKSNTQF